MAVAKETEAMLQAKGKRDLLPEKRGAEAGEKRPGPQIALP